MRKVLFLTLLATLCPIPQVVAQGRSDYLNFETPPVKPVAVTNVGGSQFVLVTNAPNNSLDIFSISDAPVPVLNQVASVPTGLEPVSVAVKPSLTANGAKVVYTTNWLGDSITRVELTLQLGQLVASLDRTIFVGDEPMHLTFLPAAFAAPGTPLHENLLVVFGQGGFWGWFDPVTLLPVVSPIELLDVSGSQAIQAGQVVGFTPPTSNPTTSNLPNWMLVLNRRGGQTPAPPDVRGNTDGTSYDYDLWMTNSPANAAINGGMAALAPFGGFGTTNFNMAFASNGDVYIVGLKARNLEVPINSAGSGETTHRLQVRNGTGFTTSRLWRFRAFANPQIDALDLNAGVGVPYNLKVTQPTDVVVYEPPGGPTRVLVAGSSSDGIADVTPTAGTVNNWTVNRVDAAASNVFDSTNLSGVMRGPRGLAIGISPTTTANDVLVIYNFIEHSLTTLPLNAANPVVSASVPLRDPRPAYIGAGRKFLYSSRLSGSNTASCASCHIDGHTDQLDWNLSDNIPVIAPFPLPGVLIPPMGNPGEKGPMVTQSLRGLVNFELQHQGFQDLLLSNKPYHWRGDRGVFDHFNGAFINLMDIPSPFLTGTPSPLTDQGIPPGPPQIGNMTEYREFINSVHYPPNPEQPITRTYSGTLGNPNDVTSGSLALLGLKAFRSVDYDIGPLFVTCSSCHHLPEGSDNLPTERFPFIHPITGANLVSDESIETAALRGLVEKEKRLFRRAPGSGALLPAGPSSITTGSVGLIHTGAMTIPFGDNSIRHFVSSFVSSPPNFTSAEVNPVTIFIREFDTGVAPAVGISTTLTAQNAASAAGVFVAGESQANLANVGLIVQAEINGTLYGFYYEPSISAGPNYIEVPPDPAVPSNPPPFGANFTRAGLIALLVGNNRLIVEWVPLGDERRAAYLHQGQLPLQPVQVPSTPSLQRMLPNTANQPIPSITSGWVPLVASLDASATPSPHLATLFFQDALTVDAATATPPFFGAAGRRHEAPRRFRVSASGIQNGAHLRLFLPNAADIPPSPPIVTPTPATHLFIEIPIYPSSQQDSGGNPIWETAVELDPQFYYGLMAGSATDINALNASLTPGVLINQIYTQGLFNPILRNWVFVQVINQPGTPNQRISAGAWRRITI